MSRSRVDTRTMYVTLLLYYNHQLYQENSANNWYVLGSDLVTWSQTSDPRVVATPTPVPTPVATATPVPATPTPIPSGNTAARNAVSFINSLGLVTHMDWINWYPYSDVNKVISSMKYLGIRNTRDGINANSMANIKLMAQNGIYFDAIFNSSGVVSDFILQAHNFALSYPNNLVSLEGPNEMDSNISGANSMQQAIYTQAKADSLLKNYPVLAYSLAGVSVTNQQSTNNNTYSDMANSHIYYNGGMPAWGWCTCDPTYYWTSWLNSAKAGAPNRPIVITETGATTSIGSTGSEGVDEATQAKQILNSLMDSAINNVQKVYLYELVEAVNNGATDAASHFGIYRYDWTPKPIATALHNFTSILSAGSQNDQYATGGLTYSVSGIPAFGGNLLYQRADGVLELIIWAEPDVWNDGTHAPIAPPTYPITVNFGSAHNVNVYDPMVGSSPTKSVSGVSSVVVNVQDHPIIVEIR